VSDRAAQPDAGALDRLFGALSDPTRRVILQRLVQAGAQTATSLATEQPITRQAVVKHLQALEAVGLVAPQRIGREVQYRAVTGPLTDAIGWLLETGGSWDRRIDRLRGRRS